MVLNPWRRYREAIHQLELCELKLTHALHECDRLELMMADLRAENARLMIQRPQGRVIMDDDPFKELTGAQTYLTPGPEDFVDVKAVEVAIDNARQ